MNQLEAYFLPIGFHVEAEASLADPDWQDTLKENKYKALYHLGYMTRQPWFSPALLYLYQLADTLIHKLSKQSDIEIAREDVTIPLDEEEIAQRIEMVPFAIGMEYVNEQWIQDMWEQLLSVFREEIASYNGTVAMYFAEHNSKINVAGRVFFHLVENKESGHPFAFMATYSTKPPKSNKAVHTPLKYALKEFQGDDKQLLSLLAAVTKAAESSKLICQLIQSGELFAPLKFTAEEAYEFLQEIPLYEEAGIMCRVPNWWRKKTNGINLSVTIGEKKPSKVGLEALVEFEPVLTIDGEALTKEDLQEFLIMAEGLVQYKGKWVEIKKEKLDAALEAYGKVRELSEEQGLTLNEALRLELSPESLLGNLADEQEITVSNGDWLRSMRQQLVNPEKIQAVDLEPSFHAKLRGYQESGYQWLYTMAQMGMGACLADDMGLGKTVQMIAFLEYARVHYGGHALLVLPASLIGNWENEIRKFAPQLSYGVLHGSAGKVDEDWKPEPDLFLYITTYGMVMRLDQLKQHTWDYVILDEAQAIKNPKTKQTKNIKAIPARMRIAMTGTPIENRLSDLWSLFDFLNSGLLGTTKEFSTFVKQLSGDTAGYARLRKMVSPFILRRLKTDKQIISDLPEKIEIKEYAPLTKKQIALYQKLVAGLSKELETAEGITRKGLVIASITKLKQICNHPDQYLGQEAFKPAHSGKYEQLQEICETIAAKKEQVLIFTQFREMAEPLSQFLTGVFGREGLLLHGGTTVKKRTEMVEAFNSETYIPYMVLSLKAGGVGLNLTGANHVIHFDRWWNPAVENQATDRAFRIGQKKNVMVHKFVTKGTIEEKIDEMIEEKQKLAGDILADTGENWITELSDGELIDMFALGGDI